MTAAVLARPHLVLVGLMGAGKTTVARSLACCLGCEQRDSDADIELLTGRTGAELAAAEGVEQLHRLEEAVLLGALAAPGTTVVSAAAWVVESGACRSALRRRARVVWLDLDPELAWSRAGSSDHRRPLDLAGFRSLRERRAPLFGAVADLRLDAGQPVPDLVAAIARWSGSHDDQGSAG